MPASSLEIADIFRAAGAAYRAAHAGHLSLHQLKIMAAIQNCRTAALGGHVEGCDEIADIAWQNKTVVYDLLFRVRLPEHIHIAFTRHVGLPHARYGREQALDRTAR